VTRKPELSLRARALQALARREFSRVELRGKLIAHILEEDNVEALLDDLEKRGWLSDERALEQTVRIRSARFGTQRITHELRQKGISEELINASIPNLKEVELDTARNVWQRKFGKHPQDQKEKMKQMRFLQSRGFSTSIICQVMKLSDCDE